MNSPLTILTHSNIRLAKLWRADGTISGYEDAKHYKVNQISLYGIHNLSEQLLKLEQQPHAAVIRGQFKGEAAAALIDPEHKPGLARKIKALYDDAPLHWVLIEVDNFKPVADPVLNPTEAIAEYITNCLPSAFHDVTHHWQLSSSAGSPTSGGKLKAHLWFWLAYPTTSVGLKQWASGSMNMDLDSSVFNSVQLHYVAAPLAESGVTIPVPVRSGLTEGIFGDIVDLKIDCSPMNTSSSSSYINSTALAVWNDDLMGLSPTLDWSIDFAREVMFDLNADADRATWVNDLAALHHETSGSAEGLDLAVEWSATAASFVDQADVEARWASFGKYRGGNPMTGRWLLKRRAEHATHLKYNAKREWQTAIEGAADEFALREKLCPQIASDTRLDDMGREALSQMLFDAFKRLGTKYPIANCRKLLVVQGAKADGKKQGADWQADWYYVTDEDRFYRHDTQEYLSFQGFNAKYNRYLPQGEGGKLEKQASQHVLDNNLVETVRRGMYVPWCEPRFNKDGAECVNTYRPSSTPLPVLEMTADGLKAVAVVRRHIGILAGGRPEVVQTLIDWMAFNVQNPGRKVRWAPLIKGVEGDGKTVMGEMMGCVMGRSNVKNVSPKVLGTDFTGWAQGNCLIVLEEIKLSGHNRYDILNAVKPMITNDNIEIHAKGKETYDVHNTSNYIAFTNYGDALPLSDTDRRWWVIFTPFASSSEMAAAVAGVAGNLGAYFDQLHDSIAKHPAELRKWLLDHVVSDSFKPNGSAPMTDEKALMVSSAMSEDEAEVREILEQSATQKVPGVTPKLFSSRAMGDALILGDTELSIATTSRNRLFSKCGFTKVPKKLKWNGGAHVVWVKGSTIPGNSDMRKLLDSTICEKLQNSDLFGEG